MTSIECQQRFADLRSRGHELHVALSTLRREGASLLASMAAVRAVESVDLGEAKRIVLESEAWSDHREAHERFVDAVLNLLDADERA